MGSQGWFGVESSELPSSLLLGPPLLLVPSLSVAFVLPPGADRPRIVDLGDATAIDESIRAFRTEMLGREGAARGWDPGSAEVPRAHAGEEVRRLLVDPLDLQTHDARRLVIVPDGTLHLVSFAALP